MQPVQTAAPLNGVAVASVGLGYFSLIVFWWYPFGLILSSAGLIIGLYSLARKIHGGRHGENLALVGTVLCAIVVSIILTLTQGVHILLWDR